MFLLFKPRLNFVNFCGLAFVFPFRVGVIVHFLILLTSAVLLFAFTFRVVGFVFSLGLGFLSAS